MTIAVSISADLNSSGGLLPDARITDDLGERITDGV